MTSETLRNMLVKQEPPSVSACYVCAGSRADYPIFSKSYGDRPFFPFLEHHVPPDGAEPITLDGRVLVCSLCYTFLSQQWDSYERNKTPYSKRIYWLKRLDNGPFAGMEMNLQQDYESLFDSSQIYEQEPRQKQRQGSKSFQASSYVVENKRNPKTVERSESRDSNVSTVSSRGERLESSNSNNCVSNALDLSMPSRTSSQSSSSSPPPLSIEACYVCGALSRNLCNIFMKPIPNCPFFPSLAVHPKPANARAVDDAGRVRACDNCYRSLLQQWDVYQRQNIPHNERSYDIKPLPSSLLPASTSTLTYSSKTENANNSFVCFTCGMVAQASVQRIIHASPEVEGDPYFSFLSRVSPHPGSEPLSNNKAKVCSLCYKSLSRQLRVFEMSAVQEDQRKYKILSNSSSSEEFSVLRQHLKGSAAKQQATHEQKSFCYLCEKSSESLIPVYTFSNKEMYFPFLATLPKPASAEPLGEDGCVKVCHECHKNLKFQWDAFENAKIPINQRQYKVTRSELSNYNSQISRGSISAPSTPTKQKTSVYNSCCLCSRHLSEDNMQIIETLHKPGVMYFPFIRSHLKLEDHKRIDSSGRVLVCDWCHSLLKNQWDFYEETRVPYAQRQYCVLPLVAAKDVKVEAVDDAPNNANSVLRIQVSSPEVNLNVMKNAKDSEPLLTTVNTLVISNSVTSNAQTSTATAVHSKGGNRVARDDSNMRICGPFDVMFGKPLMMNIICYVCGETSVSTPVYVVQSRSYGNAPFFPFLSKHPVPNGAERLSDDGTALVCILCYHSLVSQYLAYEASQCPDDLNRWQRKYNTYNYVCYICGVMTVRRRACSLSLRDFPFLVNHPRPLGALTLVNGECVVVCMSCFESLMAQLKDYERLKFPPSMRKYKYVTPAIEDKDGTSSRSERLSSRAAEDNNNSNKEGRRALPSTDFESQGLPHGPKPPPHVPVQTLYNSKPLSRAVANPVHSHTSHHAGASYESSHYESNSLALSASSRTSSFAAALRKLAKQAIDPITERSASPIQSSLNHQSSFGKHIPAYVNSNSRESSSPSSVATASQGHGPYVFDKRKTNENRYSSVSSGGNSSHGSEAINFRAEYQRGVAAHDDRRNDAMVERKSSPLYMSQLGSRDERSTSRGFQPYRSSEEPPASSSVPPQMLERSSPATSYSPHPAYRPPSGLTHPYRLDESVYVDHQRYSMIRPPAVVPYPPPSSSSMLPYPGLPFYSGGRYPPELLTQSLPSSRSPALSVERSKSEDSLRESDLMRTRERHAEAEMDREQQQQHHLLREREQQQHRDRGLSENLVDNKMYKIFSPVPLQVNRTDSPHSDIGSRAGSVSYGNHQDMLLRKQSPPVSSSTVSAPLNLVKHSAPQTQPLEDAGSWQGKFHPNSGASPHAYSHSHPGLRHKSSYENSTDSRGHHLSHPPPPPPPPLISEGSNEYKSQKNIASLEDIHNKSLPVPAYSKSVSHFMGRENLHSKNSASQYSDSATHINGVSVHCQRGLPPKLSIQKQMREMHCNIPSKRSEYRVQAKNVSVPSRDSPVGQVCGEKAQKTIVNTDDHSQIKAHSNFSVKTGNMTPSPPQQLISKDSSITRALLQNHITPSVIEKYIHPPEETVVENFISKLDQREARLAKRRALTGDPDYELSDSESESEEEQKLKEFLIITKVPPKQSESTPEKLEFFAKLGLVTCVKKQTLELKKFIRRKKMLHDLGMKTAEEEAAKSINIILCDTKRLAELSKRLACEDVSPEKLEFIKILGLKQKSSFSASDPSIESKALTESVNMVQHTPDENSDDIAHNEELYEYHHKKRRTLLSGVNCSSNIKKPRNQMNGLISSDNFVPRKNVPSLKPVESLPFSKLLQSTIKSTHSSAPPPLIPSEKVEASVSAEQCLAPSSAAKSVVSSQDPRVKFLDKSFAQEFHESVLQATQKQLGQKMFTSNNTNNELRLPISLPVPPDVSGSSRSSGSFEGSQRFIFSWPGIEAIMESYDYHISEQAVERDFLAERCHRLRDCNQELGAQIACLGQKTTELLQHKTALDSDRQNLEAAVNSLKAFIHRFR